MYPSTLSSLDGGIRPVRYCIPTATIAMAVRLPKQRLHMISCRYYLAQNFPPGSLRFQIKVSPMSRILVNSAEISQNLGHALPSLRVSVNSESDRQDSCRRKIHKLEARVIFFFFPVKLCSSKVSWLTYEISNCRSSASVCFINNVLYISIRSTLLPYTVRYRRSITQCVLIL